ncbi:MAG: THUMP domain-containing protein [Burkholderiales bacterium]|nr:THUMP domain-containing protein [Burkholderiales bacterium]
MDWNAIVTVTPGPHHERDALGALARFGRFHRTAFKGVCAGRVEDPVAFLEAIRAAREAGEPWAGEIGRVIPVERTFAFTPESFADELKAAVAPFAERLASGTFCVRVERRGMAGALDTPRIEREVADHIAALAEARGVLLRTALEDPDFLIAAETLGGECGVMLIPRALRSRYPFLQLR